MAKISKSVEEKVEDFFKSQLKKYKIPYFSKTDEINSVIEKALKKAPSKRGGNGGNMVDIRCFVKDESSKEYPVMLEVKGYWDKLEKLNDAGLPKMRTDKGEVDFTSINNFAVNGAIHYANAILDFSQGKYDEVIAIGITGKEERGKVTTLISAYLISSNENWQTPRKIGDSFADLSFLKEENFGKFISEVKNSELPEELRQLVLREHEADMENALKKLNEKLHSEQGISVNDRINLVAGCILANLGSETTPKLQLQELNSSTEENNTDGHKIIRKIQNLLSDKKIPSKKVDLLISLLNITFIHSGLQIPRNGVSKIREIYEEVTEDLTPFYSGTTINLDFSSKLFEVMNTWISVPDGDQNDVVLTPRYITDFMVKLARVHRDSFVWDFALGSGGFLVSAMNAMLRDAQKSLSDEEYRQKSEKIKKEQLLGIEKLPDVYMLAVLNMLLMGDGSSNILQEDSLEFDGNYGWENSHEPFPATVFLLNPPYSGGKRTGNGLVFVKSALDKMKSGKACIIIQSTAGTGQGINFTRDLLRKNTLLASIKMPNDIFKASVQTSIFLFEVGQKHDREDDVRFLDFSNDGYKRANRKKASAKANLIDVDASARYAEAINLVYHGKKKLNLFTNNEFYEHEIVIPDQVSEAEKIYKDTNEYKEFLKAEEELLKVEKNKKESDKKSKEIKEESNKNYQTALMKRDEKISAFQATKEYKEFYELNKHCGSDWDWSSYLEIDTKPTFQDFRKIVSDYLAWEVDQLLKKGGFTEKINCQSMQDKLKELEKKYDVGWQEYEIGNLFFKLKTKSLKYKAGDLPSSPDETFSLPALTAGVQNQGFANYVPREGATVLKNVISVSANGANTGIMFYQPKEFTILQDSYAIDLKEKPENINSNIYLYLVSALQKSVRFNFDWSNKAGWNKIKSFKITLPTQNSKIAFDYIDKFVQTLESERLATLEAYLQMTGTKGPK